MPPFKSFLSRKVPAANGLEVGTDNKNGIDNKSPRPSLTEQRSNPLSIKADPDAPNEFKLSEINDSGVFLPPSPPERKSFWHKSPNSTISSNHRSVLAENEPFSISRESFDSYRRSFDISARSPVPSSDILPTRKSLQVDSRPTSRLPRSSLNGETFRRPVKSTEESGEDTFEDVGLQDDTNKAPAAKKRGFLSRFGDPQPGSAESTPPGTSDGKTIGATGHGLGFHFPGRKRGQSGTGNELGSMERPGSSRAGKGDGIIR